MISLCVESYFSQQGKSGKTGEKRCDKWEINLKKGATTNTVIQITSVPAVFCIFSKGDLNLLESLVMIVSSVPFFVYLFVCW